ncbi:hypothetical protein LPJ61_006917, partial [Coemansia biformis]
AVRRGAGGPPPAVRSRAARAGRRRGAGGVCRERQEVCDQRQVQEAVAAADAQYQTMHHPHADQGVHGTRRRQGRPHGVEQPPGGRSAAAFPPPRAGVYRDHQARGRRRQRDPGRVRVFHV